MNIRKLGNAKRYDCTECESALHADMCLDKSDRRRGDVKMKTEIFRVSLFLSLEGEMDAIVTHARKRLESPDKTKQIGA